MKLARWAAFFVVMVGLGAAGTAYGTGGSRGRPTEARALEDLADRLHDRERSLDRRESTLSGRAEDLAEVERRLDARLTELTALRAELDARLGQLSEQEEARRTDLVRMLEAGKPREMAPMLAAMDAALAEDLVDRMNPTKAGRLLAALPPDRAAALVEGDR